MPTAASQKQDRLSALSEETGPERAPVQRCMCSIVNPKKFETGLRIISLGIPYALLFRIEAIGFPTFGLLLYMLEVKANGPVY